MAIDWSKYGVTDNSAPDNSGIDWSKYGVAPAKKAAPPTANTAFGAMRFNPAEAAGQFVQGAAEELPHSFVELAKRVLAFGAATGNEDKLPIRGEKPAEYAKRIQAVPEGLKPKALPEAGNPARGAGRVAASLPAGVVGFAGPMAPANIGGGLAQHGEEGVGTKELRTAGSEAAMAAIPGATAGLGVAGIPLAAVGNYIASKIGGASNGEALGASGIGALLSALFHIGGKAMEGKTATHEPGALSEADKYQAPTPVRNPKDGTVKLIAAPRSPIVTPPPPGTAAQQKLIEATGGGTMGESRLPGSEARLLPAATEGTPTADQLVAFKKALETYRSKGIGIEVRSPIQPKSVEPVPSIGEADPIQIKAQVAMDAARKKTISDLLDKLDELRKAPESPTVRKSFDATVRRLRSLGWTPDEGFVPIRLRKNPTTAMPEPPASAPSKGPAPFRIVDGRVEGAPQTPEDVAKLKEWLTGQRESRMPPPDEPFQPAPFKIVKGKPQGSPQTPEDVAALKAWMEKRAAGKAPAPEPEAAPILPRAIPSNWITGSVQGNVWKSIARKSPVAAEDFWTRSRGMHGSAHEYRGEIAGAGGDEAQSVANHIGQVGRPDAAGKAPIRGLLEGTMAPQNAMEQKYRDLIWSVQRKTGEIMQSLGGLKGKVADGKLRIQFMTGKAMDMMDRDQGFHDHVVDELVKLNSTRPEIIARAAQAKVSVRDMIKSIIAGREEAAGQSPVVLPASGKRKIAAEMSRELTWPDFIKHNGKMVEVLVSNPHDYASKLIESYSNRLAFMKHFEQDGGFEKYLQGVNKATGGDNQAVEALREFARKATGGASPPKGFQPPEIVKKAWRGFRNIEAVSKAAKLTFSAKNQLQDILPFAPMHQWTSKEESMQAMKNMLSRKPGWTREDLSREGLLTKDIGNETFDPGAPTSSVARAVNNRMHEASGNKVMNEFVNEMAAAGNAKMALERMKSAKTADPKDIERLLTLGYNSDEAAAIAGGKGSPSDYREVGSELVNRMVSQPTLPTQRAPSEFSNLFRFVFRIGNRWSVENARRVEAAVKAAKILWDSGNKKGAARIASRTALGLAVAGTGGKIITDAAGGLLEYGPEGAAAVARATQRHPGKTLKKAFLQGNTAGPQGALLDWANGDPESDLRVGPIDLKKPVGSSALQPYIDATKAVTGKGKYKDLPAGERTWQFVRGTVPGVKVVEHAVGKVAGAMGNTKLRDRAQAEGAKDLMLFWLFNYGDEFRDGKKWNVPKANEDLKYIVGDEVYNTLAKNQFLPWQKKTKGFVPDYRK